MPCRQGLSGRDADPLFRLGMTDLSEMGEGGRWAGMLQDLLYVIKIKRDARCRPPNPPPQSPYHTAYLKHMRYIRVYITTENNPGPLGHVINVGCKPACKEGGSQGSLLFVQ